MAIVSCNEGHTYDNTLHSRCPQCGIPGLTLDLGQKPASDPRLVSPPEPVAGSNLEETQGLYPQKLGGIDPVVGWLVCVDGPDKGRDYRLHAERNSLGRGTRMDVEITSDRSLTREVESATVSFEPEPQKFILAPGEGSVVVQHNSKKVYTPVELFPYDLIELGETKLIFIPFCGEKFSWA